MAVTERKSLRLAFLILVAVFWVTQDCTLDPESCLRNVSPMAVCHFGQTSQSMNGNMLYVKQDKPVHDEEGQCYLGQKPVALYSKLMDNYSQPHSWVMDVCSGAAITPCDEGQGGHRILNEPDRSQDNTDQSNIRCDDSNDLTPGWVRFEGAGGTVMSTSAPPDKRCNTHAPGYLAEAHPAYEEGTVAKKVCFSFRGNTCIKDITINVRNCGNFYVYELEQLAFCKLRYCTNPNGVNPTAPPTTVPPPPVVPTPDVSMKVGTRAAANQAGGKRVEVFVTCTLTGKPPKKVELEASWLIDGVEVPVKLGKKTKSFEIKELEHDFKAGTTISCRIRGRFKKGNNKDWSAYKNSEEVYTGITVTPDTLTVREDEPGKAIVASIAFPINGAGTDFTVPKDIVLKVTRGGASPEDIALSKTILTIPEKQLESDEVTVTAVRDFVDDGTKKMEVLFAMADDEPGESQFWKGYQVVVKKSVGKRSLDKRQTPGTGVDITSVDVKASTCITCGDPHITSFDRKYYHHLRIPGDYVLTKNPKRNFEIHARIHRCWSVVCNCAVAIRENNDVVKIDACNGAPRAVQLSPEPLNGRVRVKRSNSGRTTVFTAYFKSGASVKVQAYGSTYSNLYLTTPSDDFEKSAGQCGNNNNNGGDESNIANEIFGPAIRIPAGQSLFDRLPAKVVTPPDVCGSKENGNVGYLSCTVNRPGINLNAGTDVFLTPGALQYGGGRRKRDLSTDTEGEERFYSEDDYEYDELYYDFDASTSISKRLSAEDTDVLPAWGETGVTEAEARAKCTEVLVNSVAAKACGDLDVGAADRMEECLLDIRVTGDLSIADSALSSLAHLCEDQATRNPDLYEEDEDGNMVPPTSILGAICPGDCSGKGQCKDGKCECNEGFGAEDCSIDLNKPPEVTGIQGDGLCDLDKRKCKLIRLEGTQFLESDKLTCHFQPFKFEDDQAVADGDVVKTAGVLESVLEVACPYPEADQDKLPWKYFVSVSNNGVDQSDKFKTVVYHSYCASCEKSGECVENIHKKRACVINGICYGRQEFKQGDVCLKCHPYMNRNEWTKYKHDKGPKFDMKSKYSVCEGQTFELDLQATDPEGTKVSFALDKGPAGSSVDKNLFTWDVEGTDKTSASILASDECDKSTNFKIKMRVYQCKCKNGGKCLSDTEDSPDCAYSLRCECPAGFSGNRCQIGE